MIRYLSTKKRISDRYIDIISRLSQEVSNLTRYESEIKKIIKEINDDFNKRNFAEVIKEISLFDTIKTLFVSR